MVRPQRPCNVAQSGDVILDRATSHQLHRFVAASAATHAQHRRLQTAGAVGAMQGFCAVWEAFGAVHEDVPAGPCFVAHCDNAWVGERRSEGQAASLRSSCSLRCLSRAQFPSSSIVHGSKVIRFKQAAVSEMIDELGRHVRVSSLVDLLCVGTIHPSVKGFRPVKGRGFSIDVLPSCYPACHSLCRGL